MSSDQGNAKGEGGAPAQESPTAGVQSRRRRSFFEFMFAAPVTFGWSVLDVLSLADLQRLMQLSRSIRGVAVQALLRRSSEEAEWPQRRLMRAWLRSPELMAFVKECMALHVYPNGADSKNLPPKILPVEEGKVSLGFCLRMVIAFSGLNQTGRRHHNQYLVSVLREALSDESEFDNPKDDAYSALEKAAPLMDEREKEAIIAELMRKLSEVERQEQWSICLTLAEIVSTLSSDDPKRAIIATLRKRLSNKSVSDRTTAILALGQIASSLQDKDLQNEIVEQFLQVLPDEKYAVRAHACTALGAVASTLSDGERNGRIIARLIEMLDDASNRVQRCA